MKIIRTFPKEEFLAELEDAGNNIEYFLAIPFAEKVEEHYLEQDFEGVPYGAFLVKV